MIDENATSTESVMNEFINTDLQAVQNRNEKTPSKPVKFTTALRTPYEKPASARQLFASQSGSSSGNNCLPPSTQSPKKKSYKLTDIYKRLNERTPDVAHIAEADTMHLLLCVIAVKEEFVKLADSMAIKFDQVPIQF